MTKHNFAHSSRVRNHQHQMWHVHANQKKQRTEEDNDSRTSSTKGLASGKKNDAALTVPENAAARALSLCSSAKSTANPFHDVHKKKLTKKDCNEIAFGFWEDEHDKHWCLIELGFPSKGFYEHLKRLLKRT